MNIRKLKSLIADLDDDIEIYQIVGDHEARKVNIISWNVAADGDYTGKYFSNSDLAEYETAVPALIVEI